ncbi:MAG: hypothetical protein ACMUIA_08625 [bacterium]
MDQFKIISIVLIGLIFVFILLEKLFKTGWWKHKGIRETIRFGSTTAKLDAILLLQDSETKADIKALVHSLRDPVTCPTAISVLKNTKPFALEILRRLSVSEKDKEIKEIIMDIVKALEKKYEHSLS